MPVFAGLCGDAHFAAAGRLWRGNAFIGHAYHQPVVVLHQQDIAAAAQPQGALAVVFGQLENFR